MYGPLLILLEDLHFFDILSWQLGVMVAKKLEDCCLIITTVRPRDGILAVISTPQSGREGFQFQFQQAQALLAVLQVRHDASDRALFSCWYCISSSA